MVGERVFRIATKAVIVNEGRFLILERSTETRGEYGYWELPGGGLEFGESPEEAIIREVNEEMNIMIEVEKTLCTWSRTHQDDTQVIGITFQCRIKGGDIELSHEHLDYRWILPEEAEQYKLFPELKEEIRRWTADGALVKNT